MHTSVAIILTPSAPAGPMPVLSACCTTRGAGEDLQAAGRGLEHSGERNMTDRP